ncbi:MAG TPA: cyclic nucleotide-binding domain-containing protein, partial [Candidatus Dormibacteraeota bacterium]|nr:cyclic nucleotide-binding domain-containing protein [Candidatus Dormibacteraeota bacterium]
DGWVRAAAAVAGLMRRDRWGDGYDLLRSLREASVPGDRAAATWAAAFTADFELVINSMRDPEPLVRREAIKSFAKLKGDVPDVAGALIGSMVDPDLEVRRAALGQALRWTAPPEWQQSFAEALADGLASGDHDVRRLAAEAMAAQAPEALALALPLLLARDESSAAAVEALIRSGRPDLYQRARTHLETELAGGVQLAQLSARVSAAMTHVDGDVAAGYALLRIGLNDYVRTAAESGLAAMRALHGKRGFATVETGLASEHAQARGEALETLLNFGPRWLAAPLVRLLEPESFDLVRVRPLSEAELEALAGHSDRWVRETAEAALHGFSEHMKELIALKRVPLFSTLTLEQLESVDRLMVTRHYVKGEPIFRKGDPGSELFVVVEGEVRIHLDGGGNEVTLARHGSGSVVGEMSVFDEQPRSAGAQASVDTTVRVLRRDRLHAIVHEHPEVLLEFVKNLSQRLRETNEKLQASAPRA